MGEHTIGIEVDAEGNFTYKPSLKRLRSGEKLRWRCEQGPFTVMFLDTPVGTLEFRGTASSGTEFMTEFVTVPENAARGHYHYVVGIASQGRVFLDAHSPTIVIE